MSPPFRIGYIPLIDATALIVAADCGFAAAEGLSIDLIREVSWSNVRDKLNLGLFDGAHLLSPVAVVSSLGIGHVRVPIVTPFVLGVNGNAITVSPRLYAELSARADGDLNDPKVSARALGRLVAERKARGADPLTFGMTFPFSHHNYQLRFWMAAGDVAPDDDLRLVVLPPPYMVESLSSGHIDGFCVGAPWNSLAVDLGVGRILHFGSEIQSRVAEKVFAVRESWASEHPDTLRAFVRALHAAAEFSQQPGNLETVSGIVARRVDVTPELVARALTGQLKIAHDGTVRADPRYLMIGRSDSARPDPVQAAWIYAQIVRWGQAPMSETSLAIAQSVFRPDLYDTALGLDPRKAGSGPRDGIGAFVGPDFTAADIRGHLAAWQAKRPERSRLSVVR